MQADIERLFAENPPSYTADHFRLFQTFKAALNAGQVRAAEPDPSAPSGWRVNRWVKRLDTTVHYLGETRNLAN